MMVKIWQQREMCIVPIYKYILSAIQTWINQLSTSNSVYWNEDKVDNQSINYTLNPLSSIVAIVFIRSDTANIIITHLVFDATVSILPFLFIFVPEDALHFCLAAFHEWCQVKRLCEPWPLLWDTGMPRHTSSFWDDRGGHPTSIKATNNKVYLFQLLCVSNNLNEI